MGSRVSDVLKRPDTVQCPRCRAMMDEVVRIAPLQDEPGLIGYECPSCKYVTSFFWQPQDPGNNSAPLHRNGSQSSPARLGVVADASSPRLADKRKQGTGEKDPGCDAVRAATFCRRAALYLVFVALGARFNTSSATPPADPAGLLHSSHPP